MNIAYITRARIPTEKAHGLQIAKMCEAYGSLGHDVELIVPFRKNTVSDDVFTYYSLTPNFKFRTIFIPDTIVYARWLPFLAYWLQAFFFIRALRKSAFPKDTLIMTRSFDIAYWYTKKGYRVVCEVHDFSSQKIWWHTFLLRHVHLLVCNSHGTEATLRRYGLMRTLVAPNGVDLEAVKPKRTRATMRTQYGIPEDTYVAMYIGALEDWKGYKTLLNAAREMPWAQVVIVGGEDHHIAELRRAYPQVIFAGQQPFRDVGDFQNMADVLIIPNDPSFTEVQAHTSPIKLFTHMASKVPIIATDLPNIRSVIDSRGITFFDGSEINLREKIMHLKSNVGTGSAQALVAEELVQKYTWGNRGKVILGAIAK
jgi:glycosyltransferase involved in cell wall biosynthesis